TCCHNGRGGIRTHEGLHPTRFPIVLLKPLGHPSSKHVRGRAASGQRRGWDSNPRAPFGRDGLANRCRNHLATSPVLRNCPSWDRTRTLLIQSQACCQLHQGAVLSGPGRHCAGDVQAGDGARTRDPQLGKLMLYQLSYSRGISLCCGSSYRSHQYSNKSAKSPRRFTATNSDRSHRYCQTSPRLAPEPPVGFEPTTARLRIECSTPELRWRSYGAEGSRTPDLCSAIAALSQLSYSPVYVSTMGATGLEPVTSTMST